VPSITCTNCGKSAPLKSQFPPATNVRCEGCNRSFEPSSETFISDWWEPDNGLYTKPTTPKVKRWIAALAVVFAGIAAGVALAVSLGGETVRLAAGVMIGAAAGVEAAGPVAITLLYLASPPLWLLVHLIGRLYHG
jgi:hypothetical protein